ncbi:MAG: TAXI family TRAP transporter solute-binding subunit [Beijerinckiaceae bacterium]
MNGRLFLAGGILALSALTGQAQTIGIGTTKAGATSQVTAGIATIVSKFSGMNMRTQPMGGTQQYIPVVNAGRLEFGAANIMQTHWSYDGVLMSKDRPNKNLRMVSTLMQFRVGAMVDGNSDIMKMSDLKGKRVPSQFSAAPLFAQIMDAYLANAGLSWKDVQAVPISGLRQHWDALAERKIDVIVAAVGSGYLNLLNKKLGKVRYISFNTEGPGAKKFLDMLSGVEYVTVKPNPKYTGVTGPTTVMGYDYMLFTHKDAKDEIVYKVTKALYDHAKELKATSPLWVTFDRKNMAKDQKLPFHPAAVRFYKEAGLMK